MEEIIKQLIIEIQSEKRAGKIEPAHALKKELDAKIREKTTKALNELYRKGEIQVGDTINDKWLKLD